MIIEKFVRVIFGLKQNFLIVLQHVLNLNQKIIQTNFLLYQNNKIKKKMELLNAQFVLKMFLTKKNKQVVLIRFIKNAQIIGLNNKNNARYAKHYRLYDLQTQ
ncbi:unnamed protein product [Paramecium pentaurelia]|uniref:Uncharacterized protein n=1 Tax=Paramecium pentaurelia TaxID=43138 RepID=A0A8S1XCX2_9CILI|nr:unnamed protein product [Paramecium pentaurelia]